MISVRGTIHSNGNWLNIYQLERKLSIAQVAADVEQPVEVVTAALHARHAPIEWQHRLTAKRAKKSRIHNLRKSWAKRVSK